MQKHLGYAKWVFGLIAACVITISAQEPEASTVQVQTSAKVNALTVSKTSQGVFSGHVSGMTLTASPQAPPGAGAAPGIVVEQGNGDALKASLLAVKEYFVAQNRWHGDKEYRLGFEATSHPHEGESFSLGAALLYDALDTSVALDDKVCVSGKLTSEGTVERVGGIAGKLAAAADAGFSTVIIPASNAYVFEDMVILNRQSTLSRFQIIGVDHFEQARQVATSGKSQEVQTALTLYGRIMNLIRKEGATHEGLMETLNKKSVSSAIDQILTAIPQHLSAHCLRAIAKGAGPTTLSPKGSASTIDRLWPKLLGADSTGTVIEQSEARKAALAELDRVTPLLDASSANYVAAVRHYANLLAGNNGSEDCHNRLREAASSIDTERQYIQQKLRSN